MAGRCTKENQEILRNELTSFSVLLKVHVEPRAKIAGTSLSLQPLPVVLLVFSFVLVAVVVLPST